LDIISGVVAKVKGNIVAYQGSEIRAVEIVKEGTTIIFFKDGRQTSFLGAANIIFRDPDVRDEYSSFVHSMYNSRK
jgi:hypothetical protein